MNYQRLEPWMWASHTNINGSDNSFLCQYLYILTSGPDLYVEQKENIKKQVSCYFGCIKQFNRIFELLSIYSSAKQFNILNGDDSIVNISDVNAFDRYYMFWAIHEIHLKQVYYFHALLLLHRCLIDFNRSEWIWSWKSQWIV